MYIYIYIFFFSFFIQHAYNILAFEIQLLSRATKIDRNQTLFELGDVETF